PPSIVVFDSLTSPMQPVQAPLYHTDLFLPLARPPKPTLFPYTTLFRSVVPFTPMEKSVGWPSLAVDVKLAPKKLLSKNAFWLLPHGVPTQLVPLVVESNERPLRSPIGVTLSQ